MEHPIIKLLKTTPAEEDYIKLMNYYKKQIAQVFAIPPIRDISKLTAADIARNLKIVDEFIKRKGKL